MSEQIVARVTVIEAGPDPEGRDPLRRHRVVVRIDEVLEGRLEASAVSLLVHSPSGTFLDPEPLGRRYVMTLLAPVTEPYVGALRVEPV